MSSAPQPSASPLIPRPDHTPAALRQALAAVAPEYLDEMRESMETAVTQALEENSVSPVLLWKLRWAQTIEIERHPDLRDRYHQALHTMHHADSEAEAKEAADEASVLLDEAMKAVRE
ncbi:hypothetical protein [Streptomyces sp. ODS28]|uniref:hypothetical protein n=1 Tax=Streptomyces sp. ODS28 TaxID=3136688 RepID=UPI0031F0AF3C